MNPIPELVPYLPNIRAIEVKDRPDAFLVFRNASTDSINVLYRRKDGNLGLIEPEA